MLFFFIRLVSALNLTYFDTGLFESDKDSGVYVVDVGLESAGIIVAAFGYFNIDKL